MNSELEQYIQQTFSIQDDLIVKEIMSFFKVEKLKKGTFFFAGEQKMSAVKFCAIGFNENLCFVGR